MKKIIIILILLLLGITSCKKESDITYTKGVWWWDKTLSDSYLEFAYNNKINEIYYCDSSFSNDTLDFIKKANNYNIDVYLLCGDYSYIHDNSKLFNLIDKYVSFQENNIYKFKGIHLDIEPHQDPNFSTNKEDLITKYINLVIELFNKYDISFDYDIPFWLHDNININNINKEAYKWVIDYSNRIFIMSYRDKKEDILNISKEEIQYAYSLNKEIILGVECYSEEGEYVSFYEEGKLYLNNVINELFKEKINGVEGISIHDIKRWYNLKDE